MHNETERHTGQGEIILYQPDETIRIEVRLENDTVWLTQAQMAELFQTTRNNITLHVGNVYKEKELLSVSTCKESLLVQQEGSRQIARKQKLYRFLLIDDEVYHLGASLKDLGKKWFAFTLMHDLTAKEMIEKINEK